MQRVEVFFCMSQKEKWQSPQTDTVTNKGKVTGISAGTAVITAVITATTPDGISYECQVTVK